MFIEFDHQVTEAAVASGHLGVVRFTTLHIGLKAFDVTAGAEEVALAAQYQGADAAVIAHRIQYLFQLKALMERELQELSQAITLENGKILSESVGELTRAIENVEVACGTPMMMQGDVLELPSRRDF